MSLQIDGPLEQLLRDVASLSREQCAEELGRIERPHIDLTAEFMAAQSTDQLRHILIAACLRARRHLKLRTGSSTASQAPAPAPKDGAADAGTLHRLITR